LLSIPLRWIRATGLVVLEHKKACEHTKADSDCSEILTLVVALVLALDMEKRKDSPYHYILHFDMN
tara:strand:- start:367 stop:564 length:198 start_codon:yes stop_codon:yes gene_type:complete